MPKHKLSSNSPALGVRASDWSHSVRGKYPWKLRVRGSGPVRSHRWIMSVSASHHTTNPPSARQTGLIACCEVPGAASVFPGRIPRLFPSVRSRSSTCGPCVDTAKDRLSGLNAKPRMTSGVFHSPTGMPVSVSRTITRLSTPPLTSAVPSGLYATAQVEIWNPGAAWSVLDQT